MDAPTLSLSPPEWGTVLRLCLLETRRILGPGARADDAAQEATIRAWRYWDRRSHSDAVGAWVRTIARHEAYRIAGRSQPEILTSELDSSAVEDPNAAYVDAVAVRTALRAIDRRDRQLLLARYWEELPHAETARRLGMTEATVRVRLHRVHHHLRKVLRESA